ncbi:MAG: hypothetical protein E2O84_06980 [Bacteroidetes bacterium]|nr:MAG: hypothetical protein E2O84_06980 [Bacteroidota bacterium]
MKHPIHDKYIDWVQWESIIHSNGLVIDRPKDSIHPEYDSIRYPIDYGYIKGTIGLDGDEVDIFVGSATNGLVGILFTEDLRKGDNEYKFIYNCYAPEIYLVHGFINFDQTLMRGELLLRNSMSDLW